MFSRYKPLRIHPRSWLPCLLHTTRWTVYRPYLWRRQRLAKISPTQRRLRMRWRS